MDTPLVYGHPPGLWTPLWFMDTPLFIAMIHVAIVANYGSYIVGVN